MTHVFHLSIDTTDDVASSIKRYLKEEGLIVNLTNLNFDTNASEETISVEVTNKSKFETYLKIKEKDRESNDPGYGIKSWKYKGPSGKQSGSSKEGKLASSRVKKFLKAKQKEKQKRKKEK